MMLQAILEPVILVPEPDQNARGLSVPRNDNLNIARHPEVAREIVFDLGKRYLTLRFGRIPRAMLRLLASRRSRGFGIPGR